MQGEILHAGQAYAFPPAGDEPRLDEILRLERAARKVNCGIWAYADALEEAAQN